MKTLTAYVTIPPERVKEIKASSYNDFLIYT